MKICKKYFRYCDLMAVNAHINLYCSSVESTLYRLFHWIWLCGWGRDRERLYKDSEIKEPLSNDWESSCPSTCWDIAREMETRETCAKSRDKNLLGVTWNVSGSQNCYNCVLIICKGKSSVLLRVI